jgi:thiol-disulfide isomerase/thioredoxin
MQVEPGTVRAPELGPEWVNSPPLTLRALRGRAVLVDFWDYTCINCIRTLPYLVEWHRRYAEHGLTIVGVHTPEFTFGRGRGLVEAAMKQFEIEYPVVMDNDYAIWQAFANRCWPAKYLIDGGGYLRFAHFGEGEYQDTERAIQTLLRELGSKKTFPEPMAPLRDTDQPGAACYRTTPELYLGTRRGQVANEGGFQKTAEGVAAEYVLPEQLAADQAYLGGPWVSEEERIQSGGSEAIPSSILVYCLAKEINLVMASPEDEQPVEILLDGQPVSPRDAGEDVHYDAEGRSVVRVAGPRMYRLLRAHRFGQHLLQLVVRQAGLEAYAFTFVSCAADGGAEG